MRSAEEVCELFEESRKDSRFVKERMLQVARVMDGDVVIPLPELSATEEPAVANLALRGLTTMAQNLSSVQPVTKFTPLNLTSKHRKEADIRMKVVDYWSQEDNEPLLDSQRGRYLFGYGCTPSRIDLDADGDRPVKMIPSPLTTYAPRPAQVNDICPPWGISASQLEVRQVIRRFGGDPHVLRAVKDCQPLDVMWVLEYADDKEIHMVLGGKVHSPADYLRTTIDSMALGHSVTLSRVPNRAEICPWVMPGLVHINKPQGHFDQILGMFHAQGLLTALELQHAARSVWPEMWLVTRPGESAAIIQEADPMTGVIGEIRGGDLQVIAPDPQFHTHMVQDRLQESAMMTAGLPADMMGKAASNVRTGARATQLISAAQDPGLQEAQKILMAAKTAELKIAIEFDKAYCNHEKTIHVTWRGKAAEETYTPEELWTTNKGLVSYPVAGTDTNSLAILVGQLLGLELISKETAREFLPMITDPDGEHDSIIAEQLERGFTEMLAQMVMSPDSPLQPRHVALLIKKVRDEDVDLIDAYLEVQAMAQEEQAQPPMDPAAPEAMPGLDGAGAIPPSVQPAAEGTANLANLMGRLRMPEAQMRTSAGGRA